jgi:hypothetical protein
MNTLKKISLLAVLALLFLGPRLSSVPGSFQQMCACESGHGGNGSRPAGLIRTFLPLP